MKSAATFEYVYIFQIVVPIHHAEIYGDALTPLCLRINIPIGPSKKTGVGRLGLNRAHKLPGSSLHELGKNIIGISQNQ
jgi:hypothetical protein